MVMTKSGREYYVEDMDGDKEVASAELLSKINENCRKLIDNLIKKYPKDKRVKILSKKYQWHDLREDNSSFTINKGYKIHLKLKNENNLYYDINTLMFVVLHELSHIITTKYDLTSKHSKEFWNNNVWLMNEASKMGIYHPINYKIYPIKYGGGYINYNPLY
jgi:predicted metal-dependent hydrolase